MENNGENVTLLLNAAGGGELQMAEELIPMVYG